MAYSADFEKALQVGRPPNIQALFPNSKALIVSGKVIDRAMLGQGQGHRHGRQRPELLRHPRGAAGRPAGQRRRSSSRSPSPKGGRRPTAPSTTGTWRASSMPSATSWASPSRSPSTPTTTASRTTRTWPQAKVEIPTMFEAGITSIAIDASHLPDDQNLLANLALNSVHPEMGRPGDRGRRDQGE